MGSLEIIKRLKKAGWFELEKRSTGHRYFAHPVKKGKIPVPHPKKDLPKGTEKAILKQAGLA